MLQRSSGWNLGIALFPDARPATAADLGAAAPEAARRHRPRRCAPRRTSTAPRRTRTCWSPGGRLWAIDYDACLYLSRALGRPRRPRPRCPPATSSPARVAAARRLRRHSTSPPSSPPRPPTGSPPPAPTARPRRSARPLRRRLGGGRAPSDPDRFRCHTLSIRLPYTCHTQRIAVTFAVLWFSRDRRAAPAAGRRRAPRSARGGMGAAAVDEHDLPGDAAGVLGLVGDDERASRPARRGCGRRGRASRRGAPGPSAAKGSSSIRSGRARSSARASATRWRSPPESWPGRRAPEPGEADGRQRRLDPRPAGAVEPQVGAQPEADVLRRGQVGEEVVLLEEQRHRPLGRRRAR